MDIIYADEMQPLQNSVVVLGNFDGVHIAHQSLIKKAVEVSGTNNLKVVVYTFFEHPKTFFGESISMITTNSEKENIFDNLGVDVLVYQKLSEEFLSMKPEKFIENIVIRRLGAACVVVGEHYTFGANASGNSELLRKIGNRFNIKIFVEKLMEYNGKLISSSNIRKCLSEGKIEEATAVLGREYSISGEVVHGNHIGTEIGFPTANIYFPENKVVPKRGVYACKVLIDNAEYISVANIGIKPTIGSDRDLVEAHIFDVSKDFYGKFATVKIYSFIREERKFSNVNGLTDQIKADSKKALEYFLNIDK